MTVCVCVCVCVWFVRKGSPSPSPKTSQLLIPQYTFVSVSNTSISFPKQINKWEDIRSLLPFHVPSRSSNPCPVGASALVLSLHRSRNKDLSPRFRVKVSHEFSYRKSTLSSTPTSKPHNHVQMFSTFGWFTKGLLKRMCSVKDRGPEDLWSWYAICDCWNSCTPTWIRPPESKETK